MAESQKEKQQRLYEERSELRKYVRRQNTLIAKKANVRITIVSRYLNGEIEHSKVAPYIEEFVQLEKKKVAESINQF